MRCRNTRTSGRSFIYLDRPGTGFWNGRGDKDTGSGHDVGLMVLMLGSEKSNISVARDAADKRIVPRLYILMPQASTTLNYMAHSLIGYVN